MKIYNIEEHKACYCYDRNAKPMIEVMRIKNEKIGEFLLIANEIVLVMQGSMFFSLRNNPSGEFHKGQLVLLPAGDKLSYKASENSILLVCRLNDNINLCHAYSLERLYKKVHKNILQKPEILTPLTIHPRLEYFANELIDTLDDGAKCQIFLQAKITELLIMLRLYYLAEHLYHFFYPILSQDTSFSRYVRTHWVKHGNVSKLAKAMNMTLQQFTKRFNSVFGQTPYKWMQQEKARLIYGEICQTNKPLKEIAWDHGFTAYTHFSRFCKAAFSMSPTEIRK